MSKPDPLLEWMMQTRDEAERLGIRVRYEGHGVIAMVHPKWITPESLPPIRRPLELDPEPQQGGVPVQ